MKRFIDPWVLPLVVLMLAAPRGMDAQSLSANLGATKLDGLKNFAECMDQVKGHHEQLIAERLDAKLAKSTDLTPQDRDIWAADIKALRQVKPSQPTYKAPDPKQPQHYLLGLTDDEQVAINSMNTRFSQEVNLECEKKYGGMTRYSPGVDQSSQQRYEKQLKDQMQTPIDIATIPVGPLSSAVPKSRAELAEERRAAQQANKQAAATKINNCMDASKGLRLTIMADKMQKRLDAAQGLSAKDRADFEADIKATRDAAAKGLDQAPPVDPGNPNRALMRLTTQDQMEIAGEYGNQLMAKMQSCTKP